MRSRIEHMPNLELIREITTKFWDAHLKQDGTTQKWPLAGGLEKLVGSNGVVEQKKPKP